MAAISASIGIIGIINVRAMRQADLDWYQHDAEPQPDLAYISITFQKIRVALRDFLAAPTPDQRANFLSQADDLGRDLDRATERAGAGYFLLSSADYSTSSCRRADPTGTSKRTL
jgi:methyl-accepting chemotaxis protein